jgi:VanZ family protein
MTSTDCVTRGLRWLPLWRGIGWILVAIIVVLSLMPAPPTAPGGDKLHHFIAYFGLMFLFSQWHSGRQLKVLALAFVLMGCIIEIVQPFTGRYFSWLDIVANTTGVLVAWLLAMGSGGKMLYWFETALMRLTGNARPG